MKLLTFTDHLHNKKRTTTINVILIRSINIIYKVKISYTHLKLI